MSQELKDAAAEALAAIQKLAAVAASEAEPYVAEAATKVKELANEVEVLVARLKEK
jgi:hypothetical protein